MSAERNGHESNGATGAALLTPPTPAPPLDPREVVSAANLADALRGAGSLVQKLARVLAAMSRIPKNGRHPQGWSFSTESDIADMVRPQLAEQGVIMVPQLRRHQQDIIGRTRAGADIVRHTVDVDYMITDGESVITVPWRGQADDSSDKGLAKALTACQKYMLIRLLQLSSGDDPDLHDAQADMAPSEGQRQQQRQGSQQRARGGQQQPTGQATEQSPEQIVASIRDLATRAGIDPDELEAAARTAVEQAAAAAMVDPGPWPDSLAYSQARDAARKAVAGMVEMHKARAEQEAAGEAPHEADQPAGEQPQAEAEQPTKTQQSGRLRRPVKGSPEQVLALKRRGLLLAWGLPMPALEDIREGLGIESLDYLHDDATWRAMEAEVAAEAGRQGIAPPEYYNEQQQGAGDVPAE